MKSTKFWLLLIGILLAAACAASVFLFRGRVENATALIYQDGVCIQTIDLNQVEEPYTFTVEWEGGSNTVSVEQGRICVSEADCPDQVCVRQGWISDGLVPISCLPHHLVIRLASGSDAPADVAVG